jgi:hypothetical protein
LISALASAAAICGLSLLVGGAIMRVCGGGRWSWAAPAVGLATLLTLAGLGARLPGRGVAVVVLLALAGAASVAVVLRRGAQRPPADGFVVAGFAALAATVPFLVNGRMGVLGAGLVNDDMASHLVMADWVERGSGPEPGLIEDGYPLGPHSLVAGLAELGVTHTAAFAGLTIALAVLLGWVALAALRGLRPGLRLIVAPLCALPYLTASYLAQGAFKEPLLALLLVAFAIMLDDLLDRSQDGRSPGPRVLGSRLAPGVAIGLTVAGGVYAYSFPALFWFAGTALAWGVIRLLWSGEGFVAGLRAGLAPAAVIGGAAVAVAGLLNLPELGRIASFAGFKAFDPGTDGLGNLSHPLSPLEALGIWPTGDFRVSAGDAELPVVAFALAGLLALAAVAWGAARLWRARSGAGLLAAFLTAGLIYAGSALTVTAYASGKALAVAATPAMIIALRGLLARDRLRADEQLDTETRGSLGTGRWRGAVTVVFALAAVGSTFLALRQAVVGPGDHMEELAELRPVVQGENVLFLGRDNFVLYELRGSKPFTHVRNYYDPYFVKPNFALEDVGSKFDFDAVTAETLARFSYVITTRAAYASGPPPGYEPAAMTDSYVLWRQGRSPHGRKPVESDSQPTAALDCGGRRPPPAGVAAFAAQAHRLSGAGGWSPSATIEDGAPAKVAMDLPPGTWELSLRYDSTRPVSLVAPGLEARVPANLDYRGVAPFWPAGRLKTEGGPVEITASVERPPLAGRLLGANSVAHLGDVAATAAGPSYAPGVTAPAPGLGERLAPARLACGRQADWVAAARP